MGRQKEETKDFTQDKVPSSMSHAPIPMPLTNHSLQTGVNQGLDTRMPEDALTDLQRPTNFVNHSHPAPSP